MVVTLVVVVGCVFAVTLIVLVGFNSWFGWFVC